MAEPKVVRGKGGKFIAARCPDLNCDGVLVEEDGDWRCNGLTHKGDQDELEACPRWEEGHAVLSKHRDHPTAHRSGE